MTAPCCAPKIARRSSGIIWPAWAGQRGPRSASPPSALARRPACLPLAVLTARNLASPRLLAWLAKGVLDVARSIHTLVFGLVLVGIVGLGPTAGILAIGLHSMGSYGKLFAEAIESLDMAAIDAVRSVGAGPVQVFFNAVWPSVLPQFVSSRSLSTSGNSTSATRPSSA